MAQFDFILIIWFCSEKRVEKAEEELEEEKREKLSEGEA